MATKKRLVKRAVLVLSGLSVLAFGSLVCVPQTAMAQSDPLAQLLEEKKRREAEAVAQQSGQAGAEQALEEAAAGEVVESDGFVDDGDQPGLMNYRRVQGVNNDINSELAQEQAKQKAKEEFREQAFDSALEGLFPLNPEQISAMLRVFNANRQAAETAERTIPTAKVKVEEVSLDPSFAPPVVKMSSGHVTTVTVLDITGQPWPIQDVSWGGQFDVIPPEEGGHIIRVTPQTNFGIGNLSMRLVGLATPVTFRLQTAQDEVYYRFDARIPEYGPYADIPLINNSVGLQAGNKTLTSILDGAPPADALRLNVSGTDGRTSAWRLGNTVYVRTPHSLLSPGWTSSVSSADGMHVYEVGAAPVLLLSDRGAMVRAKIGKPEIVDDGE